MTEYTNIAITLQDDSVLIMSVILNDYRIINRQFSSEVVNFEIQKLGVTPKSWRLIVDTDNLSDRTFRNAWRDNGSIYVHMPIAREIHRNNLRQSRSKYLEQLDIEYMKADEAGNNSEKNRISQKKQSLRDVTIRSEIEAASTPEQLKLLTLEYLCGL